MHMRVIPILLALILAYLQGPLWFGRGGWLEASEMSRKVNGVEVKNRNLESRNSILRSEVEDLKTGTHSIEERARRDMGMIKEGEIFVQMTKIEHQ